VLRRGQDARLPDAYLALDEHDTRVLRGLPEKTGQDSGLRFPAYKY
jgi:hypothetical protein